MKVFDTHVIVKDFISAGMTEPLAEKVVYAIKAYKAEQDLSHLVTKADLKELRNELRLEIAKSAEELRKELKLEIAKSAEELRNELKLEIIKSSELLRRDFMLCISNSENELVNKFHSVILKQTLAIILSIIGLLVAAKYFG